MELGLVNTMYCFVISRMMMDRRRIGRMIFFIVPITYDLVEYTCTTTKSPETDLSLSFYGIYEICCVISLFYHDNRRRGSAYSEEEN